MTRWLPRGLATPRSHTRRPAPLLAIAVALGLAQSATPGEVHAVGLGSMPGDVVKVAADVRAEPLATRMIKISAHFVGTPYVADPLGEGRSPDPDPLARYDAFDCQTFVEEILTLALALDPLDAGQVRTAIRYGSGPVDYAHRRHFTELQWLPGNVADGWLKPTTHEYGTVRALRAEVGDALWTSWKDRKRFAMPDSALPRGEMALDILPLDQAISVAPTIRPGSVILIVREPRPGIPIWTTHMGILADGGVLRHASLTSKQVKDQDLAAYLKAADEWKGWPVAGIAVYEPIDATPRRL